MATKTIAWQTGSGNITLTYTGQGDGTIAVQSAPNNQYEARSAQIVVRTTDGSNIERTITIQQAAKVRTDISNAVVTAANQTYSGTAKTPTPTVALNGVTIPSSGYDVAYSNNTNAGTATITVTGKGDYTGTAYGTFTINQATGQVTTAPTARSNTYSGSSKTLIYAGSGTGTMYYRYKLSTDSTWSSWSTSLPTRTTAGTYNIEYYAAASSDGNYTQSATGSLNATINKASRTLSFAVTYAVVAPSGSVTKTATPSAGSGDGAITYSISSTTYATINSSSGKVTAKTSDGSAVVTATIAEGTNYLGATASYNLYVFATTHNFAYTGSVQNITLPPGSYKLQCWGAQGGSNAADATYDIVAKAGGKGGYAEGVLTIAAQTTLYAFVGGQGASSGNGGWNCGGGSAGYSTKTAGDTTYLTKMACGGGATDFALTTSTMTYDSSTKRNNRSSASLLSRIIVAGGGSGGSMGAKSTSANITLTSQVGYAGGGVTGDGYIGTTYDYRGKQDEAGPFGGFGFGSSAKYTDAWASGAGSGAGWYGGGYSRGNSMSYVKTCGGGSGFVNIAANSQYRPSGYTGIQLDSGSTTIGTSSFPSTGGGTETGHSGNGYAKITRLS